MRGGRLEHSGEAGALLLSLSQKMAATRPPSDTSLQGGRACAGMKSVLVARREERARRSETL